MPPPDKHLRVWQVFGHDLRIEFHEAFLEKLRVAVQSQFARQSSSFSIKRGLILGTREGRIVRPESVTDLDAVQADVNNSSVVGWYSLRTARDISLSKDDLDYFHRPNSDLLEIALIVRPAANESIRFGVFFREKDGSIRSLSSYQEVLVNGPLQSRHRRPILESSLDRETTIPQDEAPAGDQSSEGGVGSPSIVDRILVLLTFIQRRTFKPVLAAGYHVAPMSIKIERIQIPFNIVR